MSVGGAPDPQHAHLSATGTLNRRAALASVAMALFLCAIKSFALWESRSVAMMGSLADTGLDLIASLVTLFAVRLSAQPADSQHRFGHGKAEALAALFQVVLIALAAASIIARSVRQFSGGEAPASAEAGIVVSLVAMALTLALLAYQRHVIRSTGSVAISADNVHYQSDLLLNGAVIAALVLEVIVGLRGADAVFGVGIGLWLAWGAWSAANDATAQLMDQEWPVSRREQFLAVASRHPELEGIHDLRTRTSGSQDFVQFHMWVDPEMTVAEAHRVMDEVEAKLRAEFPGIEILIHPDPTGHVDRNPLAAVDARQLVAELKASEG